MMFWFSWFGIMAYVGAGIFASRWLDDQLRETSTGDVTLLTVAFWPALAVYVGLLKLSARKG